MNWGIVSGQFIVHNSKLIIPIILMLKDVLEKVSGLEVALEELGGHL